MSASRAGAKILEIIPRRRPGATALRFREKALAIASVFYLEFKTEQKQRFVPDIFPCLIYVCAASEIFQEDQKSAALTSSRGGFPGARSGVLNISVSAFGIFSPSANDPVKHD